MEWLGSDAWGRSSTPEGFTFAEARALERPAMIIVRGQLGGRLTERVYRAYWRWLHPTSGRQPGDQFL